MNQNDFLNSENKKIGKSQFCIENNTTLSHEIHNHNVVTAFFFIKKKTFIKLTREKV